MSIDIRGRRRLATVVGAALAVVAIAVSGCSSSAKSAASTTSAGSTSSAAASSSAAGPGPNAGQSVAIVAYSVPKPAYDLLTKGFQSTPAGNGRHVHRVLRRERHAEHGRQQRPEGRLRRLLGDARPDQAGAEQGRRRLGQRPDEGPGVGLGRRARRSARATRSTSPAGTT